MNPPTTVAEAPSMMKTVENPATKARQFRKSRSREAPPPPPVPFISSIDMPLTKER